MHEEPIDLSPLDPAADPGRWEARVQAVMARARPELEGRRADPSPVLLLARWAKPAIAAAAALAGLSLGAIAFSRPEPGLVLRAGVAEELGLPTPVVDWVAEERAPTADDLLYALEGGIP